MKLNTGGCTKANMPLRRFRDVYLLFFIHPFILLLLLPLLSFSSSSSAPPLPSSAFPVGSVHTEEVKNTTTPPNLANQPTNDKSSVKEGEYTAHPSSFSSSSSSSPSKPPTTNESKNNHLKKEGGNLTSSENKEKLILIDKNKNATTSNEKENKNTHFSSLEGSSRANSSSNVDSDNKKYLLNNKQKLRSVKTKQEEEKEKERKNNAKEDKNKNQEENDTTIKSTQEEEEKEEKRKNEKYLNIQNATNEKLEEENADYNDAFVTNDEYTGSEEETAIKINEEEKKKKVKEKEKQEEEEEEEIAEYKLVPLPTNPYYNNRNSTSASAGGGGENSNINNNNNDKHNNNEKKKKIDGNEEPSFDRMVIMADSRPYVFKAERKEKEKRTGVCAVHIFVHAALISIYGPKSSPFMCDYSDVKPFPWSLHWEYLREQHERIQVADKVFVYAPFVKCIEGGVRKYSLRYLAGLNEQLGEMLKDGECTQLQVHMTGHCLGALSIRHIMSLSPALWRDSDGMTAVRTLHRHLAHPKVFLKSVVFLAAPHAGLRPSLMFRVMAATTPNTGELLLSDELRGLCNLAYSEKQTYDFMLGEGSLLSHFDAVFYYISAYDMLVSTRSGLGIHDNRIVSDSSSAKKLLSVAASSSSSEPPVLSLPPSDTSTFHHPSSPSSSPPNDLLWRPFYVPVEKFSESSKLGEQQNLFEQNKCMKLKRGSKQLYDYVLRLLEAPNASQHPRYTPLRFIVIIKDVKTEGPRGFGGFIKGFFFQAGSSHTLIGGGRSWMRPYVYRLLTHVATRVFQPRETVLQQEVQNDRDPTLLYGWTQ